MTTHKGDNDMDTSNEHDLDLYAPSPIVPCVYCTDGTMGCVVCDDTGLMLLDTVTATEEGE